MTEISVLMTHSRETAKRNYTARNKDLQTARGHLALQEGLHAAASSSAQKTSNLQESTSEPHTSLTEPQPSTSQALVPYVFSSEEEEDTRRASGQISVFTPEDHCHLGKLWTDLLKKDVQGGKKTANHDIMRAVAADDRSTHFTTTYSRTQLCDKYKSLLKNLMLQKKRNKTLDFSYDA